MAVDCLTADADVFTSNAYLVRGGRTTLVDAGAMPGTVEAIRDRVDALDAVVLTHQHADHVGQLEGVVEAFDPAVYAFGSHPLRTDELADGDNVRIGGESYEAVHTPGHADDHLAFVSETTLFSGDVVVHDDAAFAYGSFGRTDQPGQSRAVLVESIETLLERLPAGVRRLYAGHGDDFEGDVRDVVETALERAKRHEPKYPDE
ncbi:MAG: MBL fold metallo-hydrolase [Halanaeroarchaeum sp.]